MDDGPQANAPDDVSPPPRDQAEHDQRQEIHRLRAELGETAVVEQARGILMERYGYDPDQAGRALSRLARQHGVERQAYADSLVATTPDPRGLRPVSVPGSEPPDDQGDETR